MIICSIGIQIFVWNLFLEVAMNGWENTDRWRRMTLHRGFWNQAFWSLLLAKVLLGKDEVAGSNPAISSIR